MQSKIEMIPTTEAHMRILAQTMREEDRREVELFGWTPAQATQESLSGAIYGTTALVNGKIAACWGLGATDDPKVGKPYLLTNYESLNVSPIRFAKIYKREVAKMLKMFPILENYCDSCHHSALRLLRICGFTVGKPESFGQGLFCKFVKVR